MRNSSKAKMCGDVDGDGDDISLSVDIKSALESLQNQGVDRNRKGDVIDLSTEYGMVNDFISIINNNHKQHVESVDKTR